MDSFIKINGSGGSPPQYFNITDLYGHGYKNTSDPGNSICPNRFDNERN